MLKSAKLREAAQSRSLTRLTKAISDAADGLGHQLKPPYTEILELRAKEVGDRFQVHFDARLHLHYASLQREREGLVFMIQFGGEALSDSPSPPLDELFYAALVESLQIADYGPRRTQERTTVSKEVAEHVELPTDSLELITFVSFCKMVEGEI
jgi:hypothetical protein